jgi:hypothetical protein
LGAIGIVLETKIFVDLEQTLLVRDAFEQLLSPRVLAE